MGAKLAGGGGGKMKGLQPNSEPNIVPFIDILLVLLIIFMVAAPIATTDVKVDLPPPNDDPTPPKNPKRPTVVDVRDNLGEPQIFVDGVLADASELADRVVAQVSINVPGTPNPLLETVRFRADQTLAYADVMATMAILQDSNFTKVSLVAEEAASATPPSQ